METTRRPMFHLEWKELSLSLSIIVLSVLKLDNVLFIFFQDYVDSLYAGDVKSISGDTGVSDVSATIDDDAASVDTGFSTARFYHQIFVHSDYTRCLNKKDSLCFRS